MFITFKSTLSRKSISLLLFLACAGTAQANSVNLGLLPLFPQSHDFLVTHAPGSFMDTFQFELYQPLRVTNTAVSLDLRFNTGPQYNISTLNIGFYDLSSTFYGIANGIGAPQEAFLEQVLPGGSYTAVINGFANGSAGGKYAYSITAAAVPEPAQWLLMSLGFAAVGFMVARRRK